MQVYFTVNVGRKFRYSNWRALIGGVRFIRVRVYHGLYSCTEVSCAYEVALKVKYNCFACQIYNKLKYFAQLTLKT